MMNYKSYCAMCKQNKISNPYKTESDFNRAYGIRESTDSLKIEPKKHQVAKVKEVDVKKPKAVSTPKQRPSVRKKPVMTDEERKARRRERQKQYYRESVSHEVKSRPTPMDLSSLTAEEKLERRRQQRRAYRERDKALGKKIVRTAEQKQKRNEYFKMYYDKKRQDKEFMKKRAELSEKWRNTLQSRKSGCLSKSEEPTNLVA